MLFSTLGSDLRLILQLWLVVKSVQPEETWQAAALINSGIRHRRVLVNWWQMLGNFGAFKKGELLLCIKLAETN